MKYIVLGAAITAVLILVVIALILKSKSDRINDLLIKIREAEENIHRLLGKKMELVLNINNYIEDKSEEHIINDVSEIANKELDTYEQNKVLNNCYDKILELVEYNNSLILDD